MSDFIKKNKRLLPLLALLALTMYISLALLPQVRRIADLNRDIAEAEAKYRLYNAYKGRLAGLEQNKADLTAKMANIRVIFPPETDHSDILILLCKLSEQSGIGLTGVNISGPKEISLTGRTALAPRINITIPFLQEFSRALGIEPVTGQPSKAVTQGTGNTDGIADGKGYAIPVKAEATGTAAQFRDLFSRFETRKTRINVKQFNGTLNSDGKIKAIFTLEFYGIKDRGAEDAGFNRDDTWTPEMLVPGRDVFVNPAASAALQNSSLLPAVSAGSSSSAISAISAASGGSQGFTAASGGYDFTLRAVPYGNNMAPSTVSLSARNLKESGISGLIFGDNSGVENVELRLTEASGRFYCSYETETEKFPGSASAEMAEFIPSEGDILLGVDSMQRVFQEDRSGVNLKIYNNTSRLLIVEIMNDDAGDPRVRIEKISGAISVNIK